MPELGIDLGRNERDGQWPRFHRASVRSGSVPASSITVSSDTQLTAVSPPASAPGPVDQG